MKNIALMSVVLLAALSTSTQAQTSAPQRPVPCDAPQYQQFDFWVGDWVVHNPDGQEVGRNKIEKIYGGCVLHEQWLATAGFRGQSFNTWDTQREVWHQTWVDVGGTLLLLDGGLVNNGTENSAMVLSDSSQRITWTPLEDGRVRQHWETTSDNGDSWQTAFDGYYSKVNAEAEVTPAQ